MDVEKKVRRELLEHVLNIQRFLGIIIAELEKRGEEHDVSKTLPPEFEYFLENIPALNCAAYGTEEYRQILKGMRPAIEHHNKSNRHHPEYFDNGVNGMNLVDLIEMVCDWKAASLRGSGGDINKSVMLCSERFGISPQLTQIILNTVKDFGW